jgi:hypothetical protein
MAQLGFNIQRLNATPPTYEAQTLYFVKSTVEGLMDVYCTGVDPANVFHVIRASDVEATIQAILNANNNVVIVPDILSRDALTPTKVEMAVVLDATGDPDVKTGSASYVYYPATQTWIKVAEYESMHMVLDWANLVGGPASSPAAIDQAVQQTHTHGNKLVLDGITDDGKGNLLYKGTQVGSPLLACDW